MERHVENDRHSTANTTIYRYVPVRGERGKRGHRDETAVTPLRIPVAVAIDALDLSTVGAEDEIGYILDVDLGYPRRLHDLQSDYPLAPERRKVGEHELSVYSKRLNYMKNFNLPTTGTVEKLITSLEDKKKYIVHYRTLEVYLKLGMELKAVNAY